jgi:hypothetical protein
LATVKVQPYRYEKIENRRAGGLAEKRARPRHGSGALQGFSRLGTGKEVRGEVSVTESGTHPKVETGLNDLRAQCASDRAHIFDLVYKGGVRIRISALACARLC